MLGFVADSFGSTLGATAAFLLGRTIGRPYVLSKVKDYPKFRAVVTAIERSGFKISNLSKIEVQLNYISTICARKILRETYSYDCIDAAAGTSASVQHVELPVVCNSCSYRAPMTLALVYAGTTLKDLSDITHGWHEFSPSHWIFLVTSLLVSVVLIISVTKVAKNALDKALEEQEDVDDILALNTPVPISNGNLPADLQQPLIIKIVDQGEDPKYTNNVLKL
ncbi:hypothetical protein V2J09_023113 [Rumex salicifolius]